MNEAYVSLETAKLLKEKVNFGIFRNLTKI